MVESNFIIKPLLGRKTSVPPNSPLMFRRSEKGYIYTHDAGGVNFDFSRAPGQCAKSFGYEKISTKSVNINVLNLQNYTEYDPNNKIDIPTADAIDFTNVSADDDDHYVIECKGVEGYYGDGRSDYEFDFQIRIDDTNGHKCYVMGLSNVDNDIQWLLTGGNNADCDAVGIYESSTAGYFYWGLHSAGNGTVTSDYTDNTGSDFAFGTTYYCKFYRDVDEGDYGQLALDVFSDRYMTTGSFIDGPVIDLLSDSGDDFKCLIPFSGNDGGSGSSGPTGRISEILHYTQVTF